MTGAEALRWLLPNVRCTCQSGRHQVVCRPAACEIQIAGARLAGALQVNFMRYAANVLR